tara:strand:- start:1331 stop:2113 length:783 start_codon:yes stop_codon:yes gene_type:complete
MLKIRLIPVVLLKDGFIVKSIKFHKYQSTGNPFEEIERFNQWQVDELIYLNISENKTAFNFREDSNIKSNITYIELIKKINKSCFMPLTWGGGIRSFEEIENILISGADKISLNTLVLENPSIIEKTVKKFGSQVVIASADVKKIENEHYVFSKNGKENLGIKIETWLNQVNKLNVGEILVQSIDRDGSGDGYDLNLIKKIRNKTDLRIIILGGVGKYEDFISAAEHGASGLAAANIWHYKEMVDLNAKKILKDSGINVR